MSRIIEVGPRDGLQNEDNLVPTEAKIAFVDRLSDSGVDEIEVTSFVSPKWVPQLADAKQVLAGIQRRSGVVYSALVPNQQGLDRALEAAPNQIAVLTAASETFNQKNINASVKESLKRAAGVVRSASAAKLPVRAYVSTAFWCPYEGRMEPEKVLSLSQELLGYGVKIVALGDTIGKATPDEVSDVLEFLLSELKAEQIALHFHDTYGRASANVAAGWRLGIREFDASAGGLGGCPYAPGARGNIDTEMLVKTLRDLGETLRVDEEVLKEARRAIQPFVAGSD